MQMVKKILLFLLFVWVGVVILMPKTELYYLLEKKLAQQGIKLNEERMSEGLFSLHIEGLDVYVQGIKVAQIKEADVLTLLVYNRIKLKDVTLDPLLKEKLPQHIDEVSLRHWIFAPTSIKLKAEDKWGEIDGKVSLLHKKVSLEMQDGNQTLPWQQVFAKDAKGLHYEISF